ncbi:MAG: DMT family transporter [Atribacterota bacterium]|nr:DMT family transporter [Atribacterota bacterium]MDD3031630.1 DMT family transporter [Atribacterota bacterium]MDD3640908.1 DMT family transporter [Atribacterota bacterium]MDD4288093.1 DMT family transporter [Atribacterota bacterium]MDD4765027.1 DMT family transporter [Atribacterota bacterium]
MFSKRFIYCFLATLSVSMAIFTKKIALLAEVPPLKLFFQFMVVAAIILSFNIILFQKKEIYKVKQISNSEWKKILLAGFFLFSAYFTSTIGLKYTTSINYGFLIRSSLIFSAILSFIFLKERLHRSMCLLILTFFVGVYLVSTSGKMIIPQFGDLLILAGGLFFASFSITQKLVNKDIPSEIIGWGVMSSGAFYSIIASVLFKVNILSVQAIYVVLFAGFFEAMVVVFMNKGLKITSVTYYYMVTMLAPIMNGILGVLFLNEIINAVQIFGGIILLISVILAQKLKF